jgi:hypothetical protein
MEIHVEEIDGTAFAVVHSEETEIKDTQDALDLMMTARYQGADHVILQRHHLLPEFFDLKTRIAGDILQKFSTYDAYLAIVGDFNNENSKSLNDFIRESNRQGRVVFAESYEKARSLFRPVKIN